MCTLFALMYVVIKLQGPMTPQNTIHGVYCSTLSDLPPGAVGISTDDLYDITNLSIQRRSTLRTGDPIIISDDQHFWQTCKNKIKHKIKIGLIPKSSHWSYFA